MPASPGLPSSCRFLFGSDLWLGQGLSHWAARAAQAWPRPRAAPVRPGKPEALSTWSNAERGRSSEGFGTVKSCSVPTPDVARGGSRTPGALVDQRFSFISRFFKTLEFFIPFPQCCMQFSQVSTCGMSFLACVIVTQHINFITSGAGRTTWLTKWGRPDDDCHAGRSGWGESPMGSSMIAEGKFPEPTPGRSGPGPGAGGVKSDTCLERKTIVSEPELFIPVSFLFLRCIADLVRFVSSKRRKRVASRKAVLVETIFSLIRLF